MKNAWWCCSGDYPEHDPACPVRQLTCTHDWREPVDTQFSSEMHTEVKCTKCGIVGEKTTETGEVFFPAT